MQWITDLVVSKGKGVDEIVRYLLVTNFASIHTSSNVGYSLALEIR